MEALPSDKKKDSPRQQVCFWAPDCRYEVILENARRLHWKLIRNEKQEARANVYWVDISAINERLSVLQPWQVINHFPGMPNIARKNRMGQNLNKMQKLLPREYSFYPRTWVLPAELPEFRMQFDEHGSALGSRVFIVKPDAGCQGRGIFLTSDWSSVPQNEAVVAQLYIKKPLLLDGFKFDLRIYVLVTSVRPLRAYLFQDGLVRIATEQYTRPTSENLANVCMHLTNYAVNKRNESYQQPTAADRAAGPESDSDDPEGPQQDAASKKSLRWFMRWCCERYGQTRTDKLWSKIGNMCLRTILSILPTLSYEYATKFKSFTNISSAPVNENAGGVAGTGSNRGSKTDRDSGVEAGPGPGQCASILSEPSERGSRCFEVLGLDVMLDGDLRPWLIEVNHLPSFGTDSPLDLDVKDRLMRQVLSVVSARPDDEAAYHHHLKVEAGRRAEARAGGREDKHNSRSRSVTRTDAPLTHIDSTNTNQSRVFRGQVMSHLDLREDRVARPEGRSEDSDKSERTDETIQVYVQDDNENNDAPIEEATDADVQLVDAKLNEMDPSTDLLQPQPQRDSDPDDSPHLPYTGAHVDTMVSESVEAAAQTQLESLPLEMAPIATDLETQSASAPLLQPVTPERLETIRQILREIYELHSPEKINKIDKLLRKYSSREEEFLEFVHFKYGVPFDPTPQTRSGTELNPSLVPASSPENISFIHQSVPPQKSRSRSLSRTRAPVKPLVHPTPFRASGNYSGISGRVGRAPSPGPGTRKDEQKEEALKQYVLSEHYQSECCESNEADSSSTNSHGCDRDPWLRWETLRLTEFTRLFPPQPKGFTSKRSNDTVEVSVRGLVAKRSDNAVVIATSTNSATNSDFTSVNQQEVEFEDPQYDHNNCGSADNDGNESDESDEADETNKVETATNSRSTRRPVSMSAAGILWIAFQHDRRLLPTFAAQMTQLTMLESQTPSKSLSPHRSSTHSPTKKRSNDADPLFSQDQHASSSSASDQAARVERLAKGLSSSSRNTGIDSVRDKDFRQRHHQHYRQQYQHCQYQFQPHCSQDQHLPTPTRVIDRLLPIAALPGSVIMPAHVGLALPNKFTKFPQIQAGTMQLMLPDQSFGPPQSYSYVTKAQTHTSDAPAPVAPVKQQLFQFESTKTQFLRVQGNEITHTTLEGYNSKMRQRITR